ncbi:MAG TPA: hypothetical protein VHF47_04970 [Acidimicrobiales bacterium]|nr:hypothetical protein [Acidimicrobiales bacterium]
MRLDEENAMAVTEHGRILLYRHFEEEMGEDKAKVLMDHLLPVGWTDLATKQELREVERSLRHEIVAVKHELQTEMHKGFTSQTRWLVSTMVALQGLMLAALKLL